MSIDMQNAIESDMAVISSDGSKNYVDSILDEEPTVASKAKPPKKEEAEKKEAPKQETEAKEEPENVQQALFGK